MHRCLSVRASSVILAVVIIAITAWGVTSTSARQGTPPAATPASDPCLEWLSGTPAAAAPTDDTGDVAIVAPFDLTFLDALIAHAEGSAVLADIAAVRAEHAELRQAAPVIAASLREEAGILRILREQWYPGAPPVPLLQTVSLLDEALSASGAPADSGIGEANPIDTATDARALCEVSRAFDPVFLDLITQRHYGDIGLAGLAQERAEHPELGAIATDLRARREADLVQFASWQAAWEQEAGTPPSS